MRAFIAVVVGEESDDARVIEVRYLKLRCLRSLRQLGLDHRLMSCRADMENGKWKMKMSLRPGTVHVCMIPSPLGKHTRPSQCTPSIKGLPEGGH